MVNKRIRRALITLLVLVALALGIFSLVLLSQAVQNSEDFGRLHTVILLVDIMGAAVLVGLIGGNLVRLVRDYRRNVMGARLRARMVMAIVGLAVAPMVLVYLFAVQFLNEGIDTWFDVQVEEGLEDALQLSRSALEMSMRDNLEKTIDMAAELDRGGSLDLYTNLGSLRRVAGATEVTVFGENNQIIATSSDHPAEQLPILMNDEVLLQLRGENAYVGLEPVSEGNYRIRTAVALPLMRAGVEIRVLQAMYSVGGRLGPLANSVQRSYTRFGELSFLRGPLKDSFTLTLSVVVLLALLTAVYGAFYFARRLTAPLQHLAAGTRAVAEGDLDTRLPAAEKDELGILITSFNNMIERLREARAEALHSEQRVENERANLEVILARLSAGVIALDPYLNIRIANESAESILGVDLAGRADRSLEKLAAENPSLVEFVADCRERLESGDTEWRGQVNLKGEVGRRVLMCSSSALPEQFDQPGGLVIVFEDITELLRAQKDAAWREVARRLAHEIKNPLTPIQLSAERLRRKYLGSREAIPPEVLDRATHTIVQQVEAMRDMVNAFSEYARAPEMNIGTVDLNKLIGQVTDLYLPQENQPTLKIDLDPELPDIEADAVRIRQVLHNLIRNAMEALDGQADAEVCVTTRQTSVDKLDMAEVTISDNGPGFPTEGLEEIFEPYVTSKAKGTGLGLAIVKKLVEEHGGEIEVDSSPGNGARVRIVLPLSKEQGGGTSPHPGAEARKEHA